ncbi:MAG: MgtC/SapB family protein [Pseudomonas sp.]|jgi:putative Mg2+ transporter-C (MgtC) family protein|uniref:MgtC/SapB family protein n=1 Tax=Pseudomonas sp. TaxID=306 RepID=UPI00238262CA|nr:MgtC/SapB family protein [Pseudomonas sp.]MDE1194934.1 MgtC/SapB family protein [Pseudomonas sp.]
MLSDWEMCIRLLLAALLGSLIGLERERLLWAAGLRTHMLVCVGSCLLMIVSAFGFHDALQMPHTELDPSRVAAQVVSGIGFLGAGSILLRGEVIRGLTTAASLWTVAAIGLAVGGGLYAVGTAATFIILVILVAIKPIERVYRNRIKVHVLKLIAPTQVLTMGKLNEVMGNRSSKVKQFIVEKNSRTDADNITIELVRTSGAQAAEILEQLLSIEGVQEDPASQ